MRQQQAHRALCTHPRCPLPPPPPPARPRTTHRPARLPSLSPNLQLPIPTYSALPNEAAACAAEGVLVCHNGHIQGRTGVALDDLVYIMTR